MGNFWQFLVSFCITYICKSQALVLPWHRSCRDAEMLNPHGKPSCGIKCLCSTASIFAALTLPYRCCHSSHAESALTSPVTISALTWRPCVLRIHP